MHLTIPHSLGGTICLATAFVVLAAFAFAPAYGLSSTVSLDPIPDRAYTGDKVTFTGTLTGGGYALPDRTIHICEDDPLWPDVCLANGTTDSAGRFHIKWTVRDGLVETDFDIYAKFNGDYRYDSDQTPRQEMSVHERRGGLLVLDPIPNSAWFGEVVRMSGTLSLDGRSPEGAIVYIKDEDTFNPDDLLASAYVNASGHFTTYWIAQKVDPTNTVEIQAVFERDSTHRRLVTSTQELSVSELPSPAPTPTGGDGYMELYHSHSFDRAPRVLIVPSPDSYDPVRKHIAPVKEGISLLTAMLEREYPQGDWSVDVAVVEPGGRAGFEPDIFVNLDTRDDDAGCGVDYAGWAHVTDIPVQTTVCSLDRPDSGIVSTAMHEFIHAMGVGHTFNMPNDMLCSVERDYGDTCPDMSNKYTRPSELNLAAVAALYGTDGFQNPNNDVTYKDRFTLDGYQNDGIMVSQPEQDVSNVYHAATIVTMIEGSLLPDCQVTDDCFDPNTVTVSSGDTVTWVNEDSLIHTVTALNPHPDGVLDSFVNPGDQFEFTFDTPGEYPYHCVLHPWAVGKVIVEPSESIEDRHAEVMDEIIAQYNVRGDAIIKYVNESVGSLYKDVWVLVIDKEGLTLAAHSTTPQYVGSNATEVLNRSSIPVEYIIELLETQTDGVWIRYPVPDPTDPTNILFYDRGWFKASGDYYFAVRTSLSNEDIVQNIVHELVRAHALYPVDIIHNINTRTTEDPYYPFILSPANYTVLAHGANPDRAGTTSVSLTDSDRPAEEIIADLQNNNGTWVEYTFTHPTTGMDQSKRSWLVLFDDLIFGSGYYIDDDDSMTSQ